MHNFIIYGGTYDPIHKGHIETAINVQNYFNFEHVKFLPCKTPVLKNQAQATPEQRIEMLELALAPYAKQKNFEIDLTEINRDTPSYMVHSLQQFRAQFGNQVAITLLMGVDAFNQLDRWHEWSKIITLSNILVINRTGFEDLASTNEVSVLLRNHETFDAKTLVKHAHGLIYRFDAGSFDFSSSWIREQLRKGVNMENYLPMPVLKYIKQNQLYSYIGSPY